MQSQQPTQVQITVRHPFKLGFLFGLGMATASLLFLMLVGGVGIAFSGWLINSFLNSNPMQQQLEQPQEGL